MPSASSMFDRNRGTSVDTASYYICIEDIRCLAYDSYNALDIGDTAILIKRRNGKIYTVPFKKNGW